MENFNVSISSSSYLRDFDEIKKNILQLFALSPGEVVSDRDMGISRKPLDNKPDVARVMFIDEVIEKVERYEPRASVEEIEVINKFDVMFVNIKLTQNEEYEEDGDDDEDD